MKTTILNLFPEPRTFTLSNFIRLVRCSTMALMLAASSRAVGWAQSIFSNPITGTNPNTSNPYTTGQTKDANITVSGIGRGTGITSVNSNDRYNASGWNSGSLDANDYFEWTLTPTAGYKIDFVSFVYSGQASGTGPTSFGFRSSLDSFAANIGTATAAGTTISLSAGTYQNISGAITFRLYGWGASAAGGTFSVNDFTFNGTVTPTGGGKMVVTLPGQTFTSGSGNSGAPTAQTAGNAFDITLTATLADGVTTDTSYSGTKTISYSGSSGSPTYTTSVGFSSGQATGVSTTLKVAETTTISATDGTLSGVASSSLLVNPSAINSYVVSATTPQVTGTPFNVTVTAKDANNNTVTTDSSTVVTMTSSSGNVQFDSNGDSTFGDNTKTLTSGAFTISAVDNTAESTTVTATDANSKTGTSSSITVQALTLYRSKTSGNWDDTTTWEQSTDGGGSWSDAAATPTSADGSITVRNGHTVTIIAAVSADQVTVDAGGQVTISGVALTLANGSGTDLVINGMVLNSGTFTVSSGATWALNAGGTFIYNTTTGFSTPLNSAAIDPASTIIYRGSSTLNPIPSISNRTNGNVSFESTSGVYAPASASGGNPWTVNGNLSIGATGVGTVSLNMTSFTGAITNAGSLIIGSGSTMTMAASTYTLKGNLTNDGTLTLSTNAFTFDGNTTIAGADTVSFTNGFTINAAKSVKLAQSIDIPAGKTGIVNGTLAGNGSITGSGSVTIASTGTLSPGASVGTLTFATAPTLSGTTSMEIDRNGGSPIADKVILSSGTLTYGGTLTVTKLGAALQLNDTFDLFDAGAFSGSFSSAALPSLPTGLTWDTSQLAVDGTIKVVCDGSLTASGGSGHVICAEGSVGIGGSPTASGGNGSGYTYSWSPTTGLSDPTVANPTASPTTTTLYMVTVTDANGCTAISSSVTVTVNPLPTVSVNSATICLGGSVQITATTSANNPSYLWSPGGETTASITVSPSSTTIYTATVADGVTGCGNNAAGTVTVNPLPVVTISPETTNAECASTVTFTANASGDGPLTYQWYDNQTNAITGETNATLILSNLHAVAAGYYTVAVAGPSCSALAVASLTVTDTLAPAITILGANPATNECHVAYIDAGATATDACAGGVNVSTNNPVDANAPGVYTVIYSSDDGSGNTNTATRTVYVVDTVGPVLTVLGANPATNECHVTYIDAGATSIDACVGPVSVSTNNPVDANVPGVYTVIYTSEDGNGNTNTMTRTVYVVDATAPLITYNFTNLTITADGNCQALMPDVTGTNYILAEDVCSGSVVVSQTPTNNAVLALGTNEVVLAVVDTSGNTTYSTNTVVVVDNTGPIVAIDGANPFTVECHGVFADPGASASDNCSGVVAMNTNGFVDFNAPGSYAIDYVATDAVGNSTTNTRIVNVVDTIAPTLTILGANPTTNECHVAYTDAGATASDACAGPVGASTNSMVNANVPGIYAVTYTSDDGNGNTNTATRTVYVVDTFSPALAILGANPATNECHVPYVDAGVAALDACAGFVAVSTNSTVDANAPGVYVVTYASDDGNGNTNSVSRTVYVVDTIAPQLTVLGANPATNQCHVPYVDAGATASDACASSVGVSTNSVVNANVPGIYTVVYTSDDGNGNTNTATRTVYVTDNVGPVIAILGANPATNECHVAYADTGATANDVCVGEVVPSTNSTVNANVPGIYTVTYTADDGNGNTNTATRTVYVEDTVAPLITYYFTNLTLSANGSCQALMPDVTGTNYILAEDSCSGTVTITQSPTNNAELTLGIHEVVLAVVDSVGNVAYSTNTIVVVDTTAPVLTLLGANPATNECHATYTDAGATANDACVGAVNVSTNSNVDANMPGIYSVIYAAHDGNGNTNTATRTVYVVDTTPPLIVQCPTNRTMIVGDSCLVTLSDFTGELTVSDSCSAVTVAQSPSPGTQVGVGQLLISFTASDAVNNSSVCSFVLHVTTPASANTNISISEFMAKNTLTITDDFGTYSDWVEIHNAGSCPVNLEGWSLTDSAASLTKWQFPATNIGPGQFLVVWASDQNQRTPGAPLHTNFKLSDEGEYLALVQPDGVSIATQFSPTFPAQLPDVSYGLPSDRPTNTFLALATPGSANSPATNFVPGTTNVIISEFMAKQTIGPVDDFGAHSDWIEIYNGGCCPVNLNGWSLTDNAASLTKWRFPATNIGPGEFMVVWASDRNRRIPGAPLHTNFKLADEGEYLALVQPDGVTIASEFSPTFPPQFSDVSYGLPSGGTTNGYLATPTFGSANSAGTNFLVADLVFSPGRGWFTNFVAVSISTPTPGVTIYYTTNGSVPGPTNGFNYTSPLTFSSTTVLRAGAYRPGFLPSIMTHTYVFPTEVAHQTGAGFPTNWGFTGLGAVPAYYTCNSNLVNDPRWGGQMPAALLSLPTLSVVMSPDDIFGTNGIYANTFGEGIEWERACSMEYFRPDAKPGFRINAGIRIHGQGSRNPEYTPKHNLRVYFRQTYGAPKLLYDLFPGSPVQEFDVLVLHASLTDHWYVTGRSAQEQRNQWCADTQEEIGDFGTHGTYVNLYINGLYWGMYNLGERPDASYASKYLGGNKSDYDAFNGVELMDGTTNAWSELMALAEAGITNDVAWSNACHYLNVPSFINYLLINFYAVNTEEFDHNWWLAGNVTNGVPFRFFSWDAEDGFEAYGPASPMNYDVLGLAEACPTWLCRLHSSLGQHPEYVRLFGDQAQRLLFNNGALTPDRSAARWMRRAREIDQGIISESVRWGITNWWGVMPFAEWILYTQDDWLAQQNYLMTNWFPRRTDMLIGQLRDGGLYPALNAPVFAPHGGIITDPLPVTMTVPPGATLCYTTNGTDPRLPDGSLSPDALIHDQNLPLTLVLTNDSRLSARSLTTNAWSALVQADYTRSSEVELRITDITRHGDGDVELDFLAWPGVGYTLRTSTNLVNWEALGAVVPFPDGTFTFVDTTATNYQVRFYRLTWP